MLFHHVRRGQILRTVPRENEATNESWLSDRDRYSHLGLYSDDRLKTPQVKENGEWKAVSWDEVTETVAGILRESVETKGPEQLGMLMTPSASSEEYYLAQRLVRGLGCGNIDHRMREQDFSDDAACAPVPVFEKKIAEIETCDAILLVGCNPREEAPLVGHRIRQAARKGAMVSLINPLHWPFTFKTSLDAIVAPQHMVAELASLAAAVEKLTGSAAPDYLRDVLNSASASEQHEALASRLNESANGLIMVGQFAMSHCDAAWLRTLSAYIAAATGSSLNLLTHGGNATGAWLSGAVPHRSAGGAGSAGGMNVAQMLEQPRSCYLLWGIEPDMDIDNPARAMSALRQADKVISIATHASESLREVSDVLLPLAPLAESEGSLVNLDGSRFFFKVAGKAGGEARPGWKILRKLGSEMKLDGFQQFTVEDVFSELQTELESAHAAGQAGPELKAITTGEGLYRVGEVPMYSVDALCRHSEPLQETVQAGPGYLGLNPEDAVRIGLADGARARVRQGGQQVEIDVKIDESIPAGGVRLRSATPIASELGHAVAAVTVEVA